MEKLASDSITRNWLVPAFRNFVATGFSVMASVADVTSYELCASGMSASDS